MVLGRVLEKEALEGPEIRAALLAVTVADGSLERGAVLHVRAPKRLPCASCEGGGCSRCGNSGAFKIAPTAPLVVPISTAVALPARIRLAAKRELGESIDVVVLAVTWDGPPSDNAWVIAPKPAPVAPVTATTASVPARPRPDVTIGLVLLAVLFATVVAISATR